MKTAFGSLLALLGASSVANAQTVIVPPAGGIAIVDGGVYPAGTVYANGKAYPPGTQVVQANTMDKTPDATYVAPAVVTPGYVSPDYSGVYYGGYRPHIGIGYGYGYGGWGRGYYGGGSRGGYRGGFRR